MNKATDDRGERERVRLMTPAQLARVQGCSQRTAREYCKRGLIPEAFMTRGGHWRIRLPLSKKTKTFLGRLRGDWFFGPWTQEAEGEIELDWAEMLMLSQLCQMGEDDFVATPFLPGVNEPSLDECVSVAHNSNQGEEPNKQDPAETKRREAASRIRSEIYGRALKGQSVNDMLLIGEVYQFWLKTECLPTIKEIARQMSISRGTFYRRYTPQQFYRAYLTAAGEIKRNLPDPDGFDTLQRANRRVKKANFQSIQRDYARKPKGDLRIPQRRRKPLR